MFFWHECGRIWLPAWSKLGEPKWRGQQLAEAIYRQRIVEVEGITTLSIALRQKLAGDGWQVGRPRIVQVFTSVDGTERYLVAGQGPMGCRLG